LNPIENHNREIINEKESNENKIFVLVKNEDKINKEQLNCSSASSSSTPSSNRTLVD
jgi:hypothetical protein